MNPKAKILLIISFCLNAVLVAGYLVKRSAAPEVQPQSASAPVSPRAAKTVRADRPVQTIAIDREVALDWTTVESADYREYIANLRAIGCPEETVRDIIIADINKLYASKVAALYPSPKDFKFWRVEDRVARNEERERDRERETLNEEKQALIKELLGVDYEVEIARWSGRPDGDAYRYGFLSAEKQEQTKALSDKYRGMERELFRDGGMTPENRAKFMALRTERETEMAKILTPEEFEQYQLRNSYTARNMRENLTGFQPTEDEFRQVFQAKKAFDDQFGFMREGSDEAVREERRVAQQKLDEQLKATLGEQRFHEYQLSQDERFRDAYDFTQRYNLPRQTAETVYQVRVAAEQERQRIRSEPNLTPEARTQAYAELARQTTQALQPTLGNNWQDFESRNGWVRQLSQTERSNDRDRDRDRGRRN